MKHKKGFKALAAAVLSVSLLIGLVPATVFAEDKEVYTYVDEVEDERELPDGAEVLEYVITEDTVVNKRIDISGDVTLVLATKGIKQNQFQYGIHVPQTASLTIYRAYDYAGYMNISAPGNGKAGIGGNEEEVNGEIKFESSKYIIINGGAEAAGIGTGKNATSNAQPGSISIAAGVRSMSITAHQKGKAIGPGVGSPVGEIIIHDEEKIEVGSSNADMTITYDVSDCYKNSKVSISKCTSHSGTDRYKSISDTQHILLCDNCRAMVRMEDHDGSPCSKCGHTGEVITHTVTFTDGNIQLNVAEVNEGETISTSSVPEVTPPEGKVLTGWKIEETDSLFDIANDVVTKDVTLVAVFDYAIVATLKEKTVVFKGVLQIRYTMDISQELWEDEGAYISFIQEGKDEVKVPITEGVASNGDYYYYYPVPIPEYQDVVTVRVYNGEGNTVLFRHISGDNYHKANEGSPNGAEYSILSYIEAKTGDTSINQLVWALRYYGACAQKKFAYGDNLETNYINPSVNIYESERTTNQVVTTGKRSDVNGLLKTSIQVNFEAGNDLRVYFTLEDGASPSYYTFSLDNESVEPVQVGKNKYAIIVKNIAAPNLDHKYDFSIADADGNTYTVTASVLSYALIAIDANTNEDTVNLCKALWKYSTEAKAYFGNKN